MKKLSTLFVLFLPILFVGISSCDDDEPPVENEEEVITQVILTFDPISGTGTTAVTASATDPDGEGPDDITVDGPIQLVPGTTYTLTIELLNTLGSSLELIHEEVANEAEEHMFFFQFNDALFLSPDGDGNIDNRADPVDYFDVDDNGFPLGLETTWATAPSTAGGNFRIVLKHQPNLKTSTSDVTTGETDVDITWPMSINP